eukprot:4929706-Heterocapsa_arctica.AAC.1
MCTPVGTTECRGSDVLRGVADHGLGPPRVVLTVASDRAGRLVLLYYYDYCCCCCCCYYYYNYYYYYYNLLLLLLLL